MKGADSAEHSKAGKQTDMGVDKSFDWMEVVHRVVVSMQDTIAGPCKGLCILETEAIGQPACLLHSAPIAEPQVLFVYYNFPDLLS